MTALGIIGGICFAWCGVPAAWSTFKAGRSIGTPVTVAWLILVGAVAMYLYLLATYGLNWLLTVNYSVEAASWAVVVWFHYLPRKRTHE